MAKATRKKRQSTTGAPAATSSSARRKKKPTGEASPCPGPSSSTTIAIETETGRRAQIEPSQPLPAFPDDGLTATTSSLLPMGVHPYVWNAPAWPAVSHPPQFPTVDPLLSQPTFAPTIFAQAQRAVNYNSTTSTTPRPLSCPVTPHSAAESSQPLSTPTPDPSSRPRSESPSTGSETDGTQSGPKSAKRIRISRRNPMHGFVEGAMAGNQEYSVPRTKGLRMLQTNASLATRRFKRQMEDLVCRGERLSQETECWLMLCAQFPASGITYHYTSPQFRREALEEASAMVSTFQKATYSLNLAKRLDAKKIAEGYEKQLADARAREMQAEKEMVEGRTRERDLLATLEAQKAEVKAYRDQLASRLQTNTVDHPEPSGSQHL